MNLKFSRHLKAVVFDLDGTLLDTAPEFIVTVHRLRDEHGLAPLPPDLIRASVSNGARSLLTLALGLEPQDQGFESKRLRLLELYREVLGTQATAYAGIEELLAQLHRGGIPWGISTNKPSALAEPLLRIVALRPAYQSLVCPDHVSRPKPDPEPLLLNCRQLQCQPAEAIYVGDHQRDIEAGRAAGMKTIAAAYGYVEAGDDPQRWGADAIAHDSRELGATLAALPIQGKP